MLIIPQPTYTVAVTGQLKNKNISNKLAIAKDPVSCRESDLIDAVIYDEHNCIRLIVADLSVMQVGIFHPRCYTNHGWH